MLNIGEIVNYKVDNRTLKAKIISFEYDFLVPSHALIEFQDKSLIPSIMTVPYDLLEEITFKPQSLCECGAKYQTGFEDSHYNWCPAYRTNQ